jgi:hypothetical protein
VSEPDPKPTPRRPINPPPVRLGARVFRAFGGGYGVKIPMGPFGERTLGPFDSKAEAEKQLSDRQLDRLTTDAPLFENRPHD